MGFHVPTPTVDVVDTNGAGDAHAGTLVAALIDGIDTERALLMANCAGALAAAHKFGPATCPTREAIEEATRLVAARG